MNAPAAKTSAPASEPPLTPRVAFVQDGARLHYAIPQALQRAGLLERMFTEWFVTPGSWEECASRVLLRLRPALGRRMLGRRNSQLDPALIRRKPSLALRLEFVRARCANPQEFYERASAAVGRWVEEEGPGRANTLCGYVRNIHPALCAAWRERGALVVADQIIAPAAIEAEEARRQAQRFRGWEAGDPLGDAARVAAFEEQTWPHLHHLTCGSDYVKSGLIAQGIAPERISVLPYPLDPGAFSPIERPAPTGKRLTVGCVGTVNLRKGVPYFLEVARRFDPARVRFVWIGPVHLASGVLAAQRGAVEFPGPRSRDEIGQALAEFDVFLFPSTCEGSAGAVAEAMATGLPVVTTPNAGATARHGVEGFIHPYDDIDALAASVERLIDEPDLRAQMGHAAAARVAEFDIDHYSQAIAALFRRLLPSASNSSP